MAYSSSIPIKRPTFEDPYLPYAGLNADGQGLSLAPEECSDIENMDVYRKYLKTRAGTRMLARNRAGIEDILHMTNYKDPEGVETLFAFSKDCIWKRTASRWAIAVPYVTLSSCDSATGWASAYAAPQVSVVSHSGSSIYTSGTNLIDGQTMLSLSGGTTLAVDCHLMLKQMLWYFATAAMDVTVSYYSDNALTTLIEAFNVTLGVDAKTMFSEVVNAMAVPANWTNVKSFKISANGNQSNGAWILYVDTLQAYAGLVNNVSAWSTTRFIDATVGETVIAAGSDPSALDEVEDDGTKRSLWRYNRTLGYFTPLVTYKEINKQDEDTSKTGPAAAGTVTSANALAATLLTGFQTTVGGTFNIYSLEKGTLATASATAVSGQYALVPVDTTKIKAGANSFVKVDGSSWSLEFLTADYNGLKLYVSYTYRQSVTFAPRFVWNFHNRLMMGGTYESSIYYPWRLRWSFVGDCEKVSESQYQDLIDNDLSAIAGGEYQGANLVIYKHESISKGSYVGGTGTFLFYTIWKEGTFAGRTVQNYQNMHIYLGKDDVYLFDGNGIKSATINEGKNYRVRDAIFDGLNATKLDGAWGVVYPRRSEYMLFIPMNGDTQAYDCWTFSFLLNAWSRHKFPSARLCGCLNRVQEGLTIDDLVGTIDQQGWTLDMVNAGGANYSVVFGKALGEVQVYDPTLSIDDGYTDALGVWGGTVPIPSKMVTRDFIYGSLPNMDRTDKVVFEAFGTTCEVAYSAQYTVTEANFQQFDTITLTPAYERHKYFPDAHAEHLRFLFRSLLSPLVIRWIQPYGVIRETADE